MDRLTKITPDDNFSIAMNYAFAEGNKVILRHTGEKENAELCSFISEQAKKYGCDITAEEVEGGCCFECMNCQMAVMVAVATQAAELRHRLMLIEDILGDKYDLDDLRPPHRLRGKMKPILIQDIYHDHTNDTTKHCICVFSGML